MTKLGTESLANVQWGICGVGVRPAATRMDIREHGVRSALTSLLAAN